MSGMTRIPLSTPTMHGEEMRYIQEAFDTNWVAPLGANVDAFESCLAAYIGVGHAAALSSGTAALHLAAKLCGVGQGDIVLCSDMTFAATVNPISYEGGRQVFIDAERETWNLDPRALEKAFEKYRGRVKAVMLAHLYGTPAKLEEIVQLCKAYGVPLIEDAAESLGSTYDGRQTGTFGDYSVISFNGNKIITTSGGGMLLSDNESAIIKARFWATQSRDPAPWYQHSELGYNYRMSNIVAGIGRGQMEHLGEHIRRKQAIYRRYGEALAGLPLAMNPFLGRTVSNCWLSCALVDEGSAVTPAVIREAMEAANIETRPIWKPMHLQPFYQENDFITVDGDVGADVFRRGICLPSDIKMTPEEQRRVVDVLKDLF